MLRAEKHSVGTERWLMQMKRGQAGGVSARAVFEFSPEEILMLTRA